MKALYALAASASLLVLATFSATAQNAKATLKNADGKDVGSAALTQTPAGVLDQALAQGRAGGGARFPYPWRGEMRAAVHECWRSLQSGQEEAWDDGPRWRSRG